LPPKTPGSGEKGKKKPEATGTEGPTKKAGDLPPLQTVSSGEEKVNQRCSTSNDQPKSG